MSPAEVLRKLVGEWLHKADLDYRTAELLLKEEDPLREPIALHCQQAAEKYLKAFLVRHQVEPRRTHNLDEVLQQIAPIDPELAIALAKITDLTPYGVEIRYPNDFPDVLVGGEKPLFALAKLTRDAVMDRLGPFLRS